METLKAEILARTEDPERRVEWLGFEAVNRASYWIYHLRKRLALSQGALARRLKTRQPNISAIEAGQTNLTIRSLGRIAAVLECDVSELLAPVPDRLKIGDRNVEVIRWPYPSGTPLTVCYTDFGSPSIRRPRQRSGWEKAEQDSQVASVVAEP
jgi:transcriptional regulator with XRE-family HTH domain